MKNLILFLTLFTSLCLHFVVIKIFQRFDFLGKDHAEKVQKFHSESVPRVAGIPIFISLFFATILTSYVWPDAIIFNLVIISILPLLAAGLFEDLTGSAHVYVRLLASFVSGIIFIQLTERFIFRTEIQFVDMLIDNIYIAYLLTLLGLAGLANGFNIIDGFNGLASICALLFSAGLAWIGFNEGFFELSLISIYFIAVLLGFICFNFPWGLIFLGDGGAYMVGFFLSALSIIAIYSSGVSPAALLMLGAYPIIETIFSVVRKTLMKGRHPFRPDNLHMHMLAYEFIKNKFSSIILKYSIDFKFVNSLVTVFMFPLMLLPLIIVIIDYGSSRFLLIAFMLYAFLYLSIYIFLFSTVKSTFFSNRS